MPDATGSALLSDEVIMDIKTRYNQGSDVGYRTTSPKCGDSCTYFHHEDCRFCAAAAGGKPYASGGAHRDCKDNYESSRHPCRRYKKTLAGADKWFQCAQRTIPNSGGVVSSVGGIDCHSKCRQHGVDAAAGAAAEVMVFPHIFNANQVHSSGFLTNNRDANNDGKTKYEDVLLWVR